MTHTDRTSAEILAALDKLAENGMPFIDVVKRDGFSGFHAKGAQPPPTEPAQVHEDPGTAYWKEATKMAEHTDRIKQMAQEAGFAEAWIDAGANPPHHPAPQDLLTRFAQLVAEDCARIADESEPRRGVGDEIRYYYNQTIATPSQAG